jgi:hypothetical protein
LYGHLLLQFQRLPLSCDDIADVELPALLIHSLFRPRVAGDE